MKGVLIQYTMFLTKRSHPVRLALLCNNSMGAQGFEFQQFFDLKSTMGWLSAQPF
jgi:hypothetical protein